jgi:S1-C subfamily serine protease
MPSPTPGPLAPPLKPTVGIDTRPVRTAAELLSALDDKRPGDRVRCDVLRDGKRLSMTVLLGERVPGAVEE